MNDKELALRLMVLLSALKYWSFSSRKKMAPDYLVEDLVDEIECLQEKLKEVVLG